ncbi:hypothetical protein ACFPOI_29345 [Nonomuraea angiospora]|uniref:Uncharacterized protein n=1 Tax=Nonomuraea angiospora TaxID=46172 RepID=A0ABR9LU43_9ACTN|nr:hypothetical protein [Nonomuraea angiospora]MBE1584174.1 hypothetical protein [Nonomuraea angiospora]
MALIAGHRGLPDELGEKILGDAAMGVCRHLGVVQDAGGVADHALDSARGDGVVDRDGSRMAVRQPIDRDGPGTAVQAPDQRDGNGFVHALGREE